MKPLVLTSIGRALPALDALTATDGVEVKRVPLLPAASALDAERPTVVLLDRALAQSTGEERALFAQLAEQAALVGLGERGETEPPDAPLGAARRPARLEGRSASDLHELTRIGVALSTERDLLALLEMILSEARRISTADAGPLSLLQRPGGA